MEYSMRMLTLAVAAVLSLSVGVNAKAATTNLSIVIASPPSTSITCTVNYPTGQTSFVEPVAAGTQVASCVVAPSTWSGALVLSGADTASFALSGENVVVGATAITIPRTYNVTLTSTP